MATIFTHSGGGAQTPEFNNQTAPAGAHALGLRFTIGSAGYTATKLHYWVPVDGIAINTTVLVQLWNEDTTTKLAEIDLLAVTGAPPSANAWMDANLDGSQGALSNPVALSTGVNYVVNCFTDGSPGEYVFTSPGLSTFPFGNSPLASTTALFLNGGTSAQIPNSTFAGYFFADLTASPPVTGVVVTGGVAQATAAAFAPTALIAPNAGFAAATAAGFDAHATIATSAGAALATATAFNATVLTAVTGTAGTAAATASAFDATVRVGVNAAPAQVTATAFPPTLTGTDIINPVLTSTYFGPCPWDYVACGTWPTGSEAVTGTALTAATETLWQATGQRYGLCEVTIRPCRKSCFDQFGWQLGSWWEWTGSYTWPQPLLYAGNWYNITCGGGCGDTCSCFMLEQAYLPGPVAGVTQVLIDGAVVPTGSYKIQDYRKLVRTDGGMWPWCQRMDLPTTQPNTWAVTFTVGEEVPSVGKMALGELAREYARACLGQDCALPSNLQSLARQGISISFPADSTFLDKLPMTKEFLKYGNPNKLYARPTIADIDGPNWRRDTWP